MRWSGTGILALLMLCSACILFSCVGTSRTGHPVSEESLSEETPRLLFLTYEITRNTADSSWSAHLVNRVVASGSLKKDPGSLTRAGKGDLELQVLDRNQQIMTSYYFPNPLDRRVEYVNDTGRLEQKTVSLDSAQFSFRLQVDPGARTTVLNLITGMNSESITLIKTPIL
jgi:hypothetical protein